MGLSDPQWGYVGCVLRFKAYTLATCSREGFPQACAAAGVAYATILS